MTASSSRYESAAGSTMTVFELTRWPPSGKGKTKGAADVESYRADRTVAWMRTNYEAEIEFANVMRFQAAKFCRLPDPCCQLARDSEASGHQAFLLPSIVMSVHADPIADGKGEVAA